MNGISIIICCYNSANRLAQTIKAIFNLNLASSDLELIIVNNASTDETSSVAKKEIEKYNKDIPYTILNEAQQGLNFARKKGAEHAKFDWLLYCDDDNWLAADYITNFHLNLASFPQISIMGCGVSEAFFDKEPKNWFYKSTHLYAIFNLKDRHKDFVISTNIAEESHVCGAGIFIKKQLILDYYKNETFILTGRKGSNLQSGEDTDIILYALKNNHNVGQFANLKIQHYIPEARTKKKYMLQLVEGISYSFSLLDFKYKNRLIQPSFKSFFIHYCNNLIHLNFLICQIDYRNYLGKKKAYHFLKEQIQLS